MIKRFEYGMFDCQLSDGTLSVWLIDQKIIEKSFPKDFLPEHIIKNLCPILIRDFIERHLRYYKEL